LQVVRVNLPRSINRMLNIQQNSEQLINLARPVARNNPLPRIALFWFYSWLLFFCVPDSMKTGGGTTFRTTLLGLIQATPSVVANHMRPSVVCTADGEERDPLSSAVKPRRYR